MRVEEQTLLIRLIERVQDPFRAVDTPRPPYRSPREKYPPCSPAQLAAAEARLGFPLPTLLRAVYLHVANGGFGPGYGLRGLEGGPKIYGDTLVDHYLQLVERMPSPPYHPWPKQFLTICDWGCNKTAELDCHSPDGPIFVFDGNEYEPQQPWETAMRPTAPSLYVWLKQWLNT